MYARGEPCGYLGGTVDLKHYFRKIREIEATITEPQTFVVSLETADGGRAGIITEVKRELAAKMIVEARAVLATDEEREAFLQRQAAARTAALKAEAARKLQVTIVSDADSVRPIVQANNSGNSTKQR
jgi:hypothetical protein